MSTKDHRPVMMRGTYERNGLCFDFSGDLYSNAGLYSSQNGDIHLNEKCLSGDRQKKGYKKANFAG
jgi:hypothetical protein